MRVHWKFLSVFAFLVAFSSQTSARELWVDKDSRGGVCSDSRGAVSVTKATPLCSLGAAADMVAPGDVVRVRGGVYSETHQCRNCEYRAVLQLIKAGSATQWIRWVAEPGETVVLQGSGSSTIGLRIVRAGGIDPSFNEVNGFQIRNFSRDCIALKEVPDIRLIGLDVSRCTHGAVELHYAQRVTLERSRIHDNATNGWTSGVDLWNCKDGNRIVGNVIWNNSDDPTDGGDTEGHGIIMDYCANSNGTVIENNLVFNNEGYCIRVFHTNGAIVRNNVCYRNGLRQEDSGEIGIQANKVSIYNNVVVPRSGKFALGIQYSGSGFSVDPATISENHNLFHVSEGASSVAWANSAGTLAQYRSQNGRGWGTQTFAADPRFVDPAAFNFRLQAGSPAIDKGNSAEGAAKDFDGQPRPQGTAADIGAYEVSSGPTLAGSMYFSSAPVNLSATGTRDWAKWPNYIRKANVTPQISNFAVVGTGAAAIYNSDARVLSWSDGTPTAAASDRSGVKIGPGKGYQITAPAGIGVRTLKIYVGGWLAVGKLTAQLSDNSVPVYVSVQGNAAGSYDAVYTLTYRAKSDGQRIVVNWVHSSGTGTVNLQAATLQ